MRRASRCSRGARALAVLAFGLGFTTAAHVRAADPFGCDRHGPEHPDLATIRYDDPRCRRTAWLGLDVGGVAVPARLGLFSRTVWTVHVAPAWSVRIARWVSLGGRHSLGWYDAQNIRLRVHTQQVEAAFHPLEASGRARMHDRLAAGVETHALAKATVDGLEFKLGGVRDTVAYIGYGIDHAIARRWTLGWQAQFRHAWVFEDTQRQVRASVRAAFHPRPDHRIAAEAVAFVVHRNRDQAGTPMPRVGGYGQFAIDWSWMSRVGIGPAVRLRATTGFLAGEAPIYEMREEALGAPYGEAIVGLRAVWR